MKSIIFEIIGMLGMAQILLSFFMAQSKRWDPAGKIYNFDNFFGSAFLLIYSVYTGYLPFIILNTVWLLVSLKGLWVIYGGKK